MRLWSLHPSLLDARGLVALWREGLLARKVLRGETRGYRHHPQLERFRRGSIDCYLSRVYDEAIARGYVFDRSKIRYAKQCRSRRPVTDGQLAYELAHLRRKLRQRAPERRIAKLLVHPCFKVRRGAVESWERAR